jgi:guanylate kinase
MDSGVKPSGTDPNATKDQILSAELGKLKEFRNQMKEENNQYLEKHPELRTILDDFVAAIITQKPNDVIKFGEYYFSTLNNKTHIGPTPIVIAGPSGVGKGTLIKLLLDKYPNMFGFSVSHTTRPPRPGEENGVHYNFVSLSEMKAGVGRNEFVEYATVHTSMYGTSKAAILKIREQNKICILDIDMQGVQSVKKSNIDCKYVFIAPPSMEELEKRLRGRATETDDKIEIRLQNAISEVAYGTTENFDCILVNDNLEETFKSLMNRIITWYPNLDLPAL